MLILIMERINIYDIYMERLNIVNETKIEKFKGEQLKTLE